jgi:hypothetical protein
MRVQDYLAVAALFYLTYYIGKEVYDELLPAAPAIASLEKSRPPEDLADKYKDL